ncbi:BTAD domain-containing putative transcriptional regulator [Catenuloplanes indicus]|uniref:ATPase n=1 Tax=Catenuloplanes indicus TaxID=137267 RepID=A0AAE3W8H1_9ACTN|nr:BTAD domain-containing putative transcriptional regulator [Catenuloplanes indicus]MDQ0371225.1 putative ATPase [Catenuloplanes indicus]
MRRYAVLGPTEVLDGDRPVHLGGPLPRRLLTALIAAEGAAVPDDRLSEAVWPGRPPGRAATLQVYVSRLRRALGDGVLVRTGGGYALAVPPGATDAGRFRQLAADGRALAAADRPAQAREVFEEALLLWRGEPYADLPGAAAREPLIALREAVLEESAEAGLAAGQHARAVAELEALTRAEPYRERRWALFALALYRSGRQADALDAMRRMRELLADELGVDPGPELRRLERRILSQDPELTGAPGRPARPLSSFVGRDADLRLLDKLASGHRLVTVAGPAGVGKTRLIIEYAAGVTGEAWLARLADVTDPALITSAIAAATGVTGTVSDPLDRVARALAGRDGLLLLDNCEHLPGAVAEVALALLARAPGLRVLATSRAPLGVDGEQILPLGPLAVDDAVALLGDRIRAVRPAWAARGPDEPDVRRLATALDGIPLALELAAARARTLSLRELIEHLGDRFALLGHIPRGLPNPHATLQAAIAWSVDLLAPVERERLLRLWPFEGGLPLTAAAAVWSAAPLAAVETLDALVGQSVVTADPSGPPARYLLLETVRAFCRAADPDPAASRENHAAWVRDLVATASADLLGARSAEAMRVLHRELPNIRAAIAHDLDRAPEAALRTGAALMWFWIRGGLVDEGRDVLSGALRAAAGAPAADVHRARAALAGLIAVSGEMGTARAMLVDTAARLGAGGDERLLGEVRYYESMAHLWDGDPASALEAATEAHRLAVETGTEWLIPSAAAVRGAALIGSGRVTDGRRQLRAAAEGAVHVGQFWTAALSDLMLAQTLDGRPAEALSLLRSAVRTFRREDDLNSVLAVLEHAAVVLDALGDTGRAALLRAAVHHHLTRFGVRAGRTYIGTVTPAGPGPAAPPADPPSLSEAIAALESE